MAYDDQNVFAKILRGEIPAHTVYEDAHCVAFMDIMPQVEGHTLVIPRAPVEDFFDIDPETLAHTVKATQIVARAVKEAFAAPGVMIAQLNGSAAGQTVFHLHFHVMPRHSGVEMRMHAREMADQAALAADAAKVRAALAKG